MSLKSDREALSVGIVAKHNRDRGGNVAIGLSLLPVQFRFYNLSNY
ncbi:MAG: hypothetical protein QNJ72_18680 [Pleurocapsa sp. MO_226.B13]|nr:hypothetical protein [Pleurocapsa sp. MO_226.B13]